VLIYGYGVMGRGVAKTFADAGFATSVKSSRGESSKAAVEDERGRTLPKEAPDLVIEFVPEDVRVKQGVYAEIEAAVFGQFAGQRAADCVGDLGARSGRAGAQD